MNTKRILSTALTVVLVFTMLIAAFPVTALAAHSESSVSASAKVPEGVTEANLNSEELEAYLTKYLEYNYDSAAAMLSDELAAGYLYYANSSNGNYTMYVNKYTGFVYYVNNVTGQILTSNPINPGYLSENGAVAVQREFREELMSQIVVSFFESANSLKSYNYTSHKWAAKSAQIDVTAISGGLRVSYTLGDTTARFLLPGQVVAKDFEETILLPMLDRYQELLEEYCSEKYPDENLSFFDNADYEAYDYECINSKDLKKYFKDAAALYTKALGKNSPEFKNISQLQTDILKIMQAYSAKIPQKYIDSGSDSLLEIMHTDFPKTKDGTAIYVYSSSDFTEEKRPLSEIIKKYCPNYTFSIMFAQEKECGYVDNSLQKPVIRCALEYTFNSDGSLSVRLPANAITFDETVYTFKDITPIKFFGAGDMSQPGYMFYPDGSGTVIEFDDFYNEQNNKKIALNLTSNVYGSDFCYSKITGANREQITMPVYGIVNDVKANPKTTEFGVSSVTNGFFAIVEEGSALANLGFTTGGSVHRFAGVFASYTPYPSDEYDLSETMSVGSLGTYTIVSESKYTGSYVTRIVMLTDETVGNKQMQIDAKPYYESSYVGMASYYRDYLKANGVLSALEDVNANLPLYIEVLGSMNILSRFLSFPVTKSIPLSTFDDVATMYEELAKCEEYVGKKVEEYEKLAAEEEDETQKYQYQRQADRYRELIGEVKNIPNINMKLTGFANGGMSALYPTKIKWQKSVGGRSGFKTLIKDAATISEADGINFSVYPDFDFMYISNTKAFDGVKEKTDASKMVDNRYASKQEYNSILQTYEQFFTLVVNPSALDRLYSKFESKYSKYDIKNLSVSTLGSDLNSNFNEKEPINREQASEYVSQVLDRMANENNYELMIDTGNIYAVEYATHILNATTDSSHFRYSSYAIPFLGMILHGYVNYAGAPLNYSGSPDYDILRSIESGASLYYIVCYQNTSYMKDDMVLSKYYGVDYHNWYDDIVSTYKELDEAIGDLQKHEIVDHRTLIAERIIEAKEEADNYVLLKNELLTLLDSQLLSSVDATLAALRADDANLGKRVKVDLTDAEVEGLIAVFADILNLTVEELKASDFDEAVYALVAKYEAVYAGASDPAMTVPVVFGGFNYVSNYKFITDSIATDPNYNYTKYTVDDGNVTMVTYKNGDSVVRFILNYNNFSVSVKLDAEHTYNIPKHSYARID